MRLFEIYHKYEDMTFAEYLETLLQTNVAKIASGNFAAVIIPKNRNFIYKLWINDVGFESWVAFCKANQSNQIFGSLLPKFIKDTVVLNIPFSRNTRYKDTKMKIQRIEKLDSGYVDFSPITIDTYHEFDNWPELLKFMFDSKIKSVEFDDDYDDEDKEYISGTITKIEALFGKIGKKFGKQIDSEPENPNFLFRSNGDIVLTDIFFDDSDREETIHMISWDGTLLPQSINHTDEYYADDKDPISVVKPYTKDASTEFVKGRASTIPKFDWTKPSLPPTQLNWFRNHSFSELFKADENAHETIMNNPSLIMKLADIIAKDDPYLLGSLVFTQIHKFPKSFLDKYEDNFVDYALSNDEFAEEYIHQYGEWPALKKQR
jgi:hypothetical protein